MAIQIENPADDPRDFIQAGREDDDDILAADNFLCECVLGSLNAELTGALVSLQNLMRPIPPPTRPTPFGSGAPQTTVRTILIPDRES